ncbi:M20/M25/M40 family metallo-hydrolase [Pseudonocardia abyssalis]|uniref:M20/M25/M40 family metallo-hydrolase n=1 Tax=Pseudonocardia abyssalis TaxID=2792008 RepID=A0ABS6UTI3_9PSEU|nr:M20/M25/M40 family metallo-hydrolase [Pseudonocardia abyssalis]MBW0118408.1 M20/M25/M40 family metallo-hydrolase [Pseudonocardia abyssalis]MBW0135564.1 M20/M25/M40 family metallo-hydrolase [Pseudonocardia abyssalis]
MGTRTKLIVAVALVGLVASVVAIVAYAPGCDDASPADAAALVECVTVDDVRAHQRALQDIADANGGNRASGTPGYDASVAYVAEQARAAGLTVTTQDFEFPFFQVESESLARNGRGYAAGTDFATMTFSGSGDVTGTAVPVDVALPPAGPSTSGCEADDFDDFPAGSVALLRRGTCPFGDKAANAVDAGASGVVIVNSGDTPENSAVLQGTLTGPVGIPVVGATSALADELADARVTLSTVTVNETRSSTNVLAETRGGTGERVLMVGAHLDSVPEGPGINDNGSGSAAILAVAQRMASASTERTVRFAWWGSEELGLLGATDYVATLSAPEAERIDAYLNFDMVGSPNAVRFVYDGDDSDAEGAPAGPDGSAEIEDVFEAFYDGRGLAYEGTDFDGRSDYGPFIEAGIPAGGLFTGAEGVTTPEQAAAYGGEAGTAYDPCYHAACDTYDNVDVEVLDQNADAVAHTVLTLAGR